jgi:hypothetical protein
MGFLLPKVIRVMREKRRLLGLVAHGLGRLCGGCGPPLFFLVSFTVASFNFSVE